MQEKTLNRAEIYILTIQIQVISLTDSLFPIRSCTGTAKSAAAYLTSRLIGWDIAITEEGPVLSKAT